MFFCGITPEDMPKNRITEIREAKGLKVKDLAAMTGQFMRERLFGLH